jgi:CcdB protein
MPVFSIDGVSYVMATHLASAVGVADLGILAGSLSSEADTIIAAMDVLISGY